MQSNELWLVRSDLASSAQSRLALAVINRAPVIDRALDVLGLAFEPIDRALTIGAELILNSVRPELVEGLRTSVLGRRVSTNLIRTAR